VLTPDETARRSAEAMLAGDQASLAAGVELVGVGPGTATATMTVRTDMVNGHRDRRVDEPDDVAAVGAVVAPVHAGDRLTAEARETHRAGRNGIYDVSVRREDGTVVAELRGRSRTIKGTLVPQEEDPT